MRLPKIRKNRDGVFFILEATHNIYKDDLVHLICACYFNESSNELESIPDARGLILDDCKVKAYRDGFSLFQKDYPDNLIAEALELVERLFPELHN